MYTIKYCALYYVVNTALYYVVNTALYYVVNTGTIIIIVPVQIKLKLTKKTPNSIYIFKKIIFSSATIL